MPLFMVRKLKNFLILLKFFTEFHFSFKTKMQLVLHLRNRMTVSGRILCTLRVFVSSPDQFDDHRVTFSEFHRQINLILLMASIKLAIDEQCWTNRSSGHINSCVKIDASNLLDLIKLIYLWTLNSWPLKNEDNFFSSQKLSVFGFMLRFSRSRNRSPEAKNISFLKFAKINFR